GDVVGRALDLDAGLGGGGVGPGEIDLAAAGCRGCEVGRSGGRRRLRRGAGGIGVRRVAGSIRGAHAIEIGGRGAQAGVRVADRGGAGDGDLGEGDVVGRALDLDAGLGGRGVGPGEVDLT